MQQPSRVARLVAAVAAVSVVLSGCRDDPPVAAEDAVQVGTSRDPESRVLAEVAAALVRAADLEATVVPLADAEDARRALEVGDVDVLLSYSGDAWLRVLGRGDPPSDPATSLARVREFDARNDLLWLRPTVAQEESLTSPPADATFAFVVLVADQDGPTVAAEVTTLSQLASLLGQLEDPQLCVDPVFLDPGRGDVEAAGEGPRGRSTWDVVLAAYSIAPDEVTPVEAEPTVAVAAVAGGECVAGLTSATDGAAWASGLRPLVDDLGVFPAFVVAPVLREEARAEHDGLEAALQPMLSGLTTARLGMWNARVATGEDPATVASDAVVELTSGG